MKLSIQWNEYIILGFGDSGRWTAKFLEKNGFSVKLWDDAGEKQQIAKKTGFTLLASFQELTVTNPATTCLVVAPGVGSHPLVDLAKTIGVQILCDVQLFFCFFPKIQAIGITGTNGKSTVSSMIAYGLAKQGISVLLAGNIGVPIFSTVEQDGFQEHLYILELSSYQLELCWHLPLLVAVLLNIVEHHLERHGSMTVYQSIKEKIYSFAPVALTPESAMYLYQQEVIQEKHCSGKDFDPERFNKAVAHWVLRALGYEDSKALEGFKPLSHRQESIGTFNGISYWNDSKATNPHACAVALERFSRDAIPIYWIAGGVLQKDDLDPLLKALPKVKHGFFFGAAAKRYVEFSTIHGLLHSMCDTLEEAVLKSSLMALDFSRPCQVVFSPGCASFDQFRNFVHRGECFREYVESFWREKC